MDIKSQVLRWREWWWPKRGGGHVRIRVPCASEIVSHATWYLEVHCGYANLNWHGKAAAPRCCESTEQRAARHGYTNNEGETQQGVAAHPQGTLG